MEGFRNTAWELTLALVGSYLAIRDLPTMSKGRLAGYIALALAVGYSTSSFVAELLMHNGYVSAESNDAVEPFLTLIFSAGSLKLLDLLNVIIKRANRIKLPGEDEK